MPERDLFVFTPRRGRFSPAVDVFYVEDPPRAVVQAELAGVEPDAVTLEVHGRVLVLSGQRRPPSGEGCVFQQLEIEHGRFRRTIELGADVEADAARATFEDGILRVELPLRATASPRALSVPIGRGSTT